MRDEEEEEVVRTTMWGAHVRNVWISWGGSGGWEQGETSTPDLEQPQSHHGVTVARERGVVT